MLRALLYQLQMYALSYIQEKTMSQSNIPHGFTVAQFDDKHWYPIEVKRCYSIEFPEGFLSLKTLDGFLQDQWVDDIHFARRSDALVYCQQEATKRHQEELRRWERVTVQSNVYPDRCVHYIDLMTEITGRFPFIHQFMYQQYPCDSISVSVRSWVCCANKRHPEVAVHDALRIEDALEEAANRVYASYQACQCSLHE